jgi:hypothetical protein
MTAITSKTFQYAPTMGLPVGVRQVAEALTAGGRLLARLLTTTSPLARRSRAVEAEEVRVMARGWERTDPGFAADLYAAAARHEGLDD